MNFMIIFITSIINEVIDKDITGTFFVECKLHASTNTHRSRLISDYYIGLG